MFWKHHEPDFDHEKFSDFLDGLILGKMEFVMADLAKLQADIDAQGPLISALKTKVDAQAAKISELEAQIAAAPAGDPQGPVDALAASVEANNATLKDAGA